MYLPAFTVLGLIYPIAALTAAFARTHLWRGVTYQMHREGVQMVGPSVETKEAETWIKPH
jgi:hypothetical protein